MLRPVKAHWRSLLTIVTPFALAAIPLTAAEDNHDAMWTLYTICVMAVYW